MSQMTPQPGMMLRNGSRDTAVVTKDGTVFELKHNGEKFNFENRSERKTFPDLASWAAYLNVPAGDIEVCWPTKPAAPDPLERHFIYNTQTPHWRIVEDVMEAFKLKTGSEPLPNYKNRLITAKIELLKLELDPPIYESRYGSLAAARICMTHSAEYFENMMAKNPENRRLYYVRGLPKIFIKTEQSTMLPLGVNAVDEKIIVNKIGYTRFSEAAAYDINGIPDIWVLHKKQMVKVRISIV